MSPMIYRWAGDSMVPIGRYAAEARRMFIQGEHYRLAAVEERSAKSHAHYFACLHAAWLTLPEDQADRFPTEDHLRKYALIKCGYADERSLVCSSKAEARRIAAFIKPMETISIVTVSNRVVRVFTAKSQSYGAMNKAVFAASKQAVLDYVAGLIGAKAENLATDHD